MLPFWYLESSISCCSLSNFDLNHSCASCRWPDTWKYITNKQNHDHDNNFLGFEEMKSILISHITHHISYTSYLLFICIKIDPWPLLTHSELFGADPLSLFSSSPLLLDGVLNPEKINTLTSSFWHWAIQINMKTYCFGKVFIYDNMLIVLISRFDQLNSWYDKT